MFTIYADYAIDLIVDVAAIFLLAYVLYFRRHRRADLLLGYVALNIGIFVAMSLLGKVRVDIALGFGLFAILSIIRLRSTSVTQQEVAYYFIALVMGLVNGLDIDDRRLVVIVNVLLIATMAIVDSRPLRDRARRMDVHLDVIHSDDAVLVADLERRLGGTVMYHEVNDIDYVRETMVVDVRYRAGTVAAQEKVDDRRLEVTLDVIHTDATPLLHGGTLTGLGTQEPCGHADFYPNAGKDQPGCNDGVVQAIVQEKGLAQVSDTGAIEEFCDEVIAANPGPASDFKAGKVAALNFLKGQVMKLSKGKANPAVVGEILEKKSVYFYLLDYTTL